MPAPKKFKDPSKSVFKGTLLPPNPKAAKLPLIATTPDESGSVSATKTIRQSDITRTQNIREALKAGWTNVSKRTLDYLQVGDRLERLLDESKLRDIGIFAGISTEKTLLMEGQPTAIIGYLQHKELDKLGLALQDALQQRGLVTLTERKVDIKLNGPGTSQQTS